VTTHDLLPEKVHRYWYSCSIVHSLCRRLNGSKIRDVGSKHTEEAFGDDERCVVLACFVLPTRFGQLRLMREFLVVPFQGPSHNQMDKFRKQVRGLESLEVLGASSMRAHDLLYCSDH
jgi:hypothetical protein